MADSGNPTQWGDSYPPQEMLEEDIDSNRLFVYTVNGCLEAVFAFILGPDPTYAKIEDGQWLNDEVPYGTIHRLASTGDRRGVASEVIAWCLEHCESLRADTHADNKIMQHLLEKNGFARCGIIHVEDGTPRVAYQKLSATVHMKDEEGGTGMKITQVKLGRISTPLRVPFKTALRTVSSVEDVIVELHTDTGAVGYGEAPPTGVITGDTTGAIIGAIRDHIAPAILGRGLDEFEDLTAAVQKALVHNTSAKAAVDMALWDLLGQKYSAPVYRMLGGARSNIVTDITISVNPPEEMARDARTAIQRGYDCLKVKVGIDPELDVARLAAVREAVGKDVKLRIDANQAWNAKQAVRILDQMQEKGLDIEFVEQPVPAADLEGMQYVTRHASVPVLADESVFSPADALRIMQTGAADFVNIKLMKCGGITNALRIASAAEVYGVECMIGCMLEAKISVNAAVELACAKKIITKVDLDGPVLCSEDHILGGAVFDEKNITVSDAPGMGIQGFVPGKVTYLDD